MINFVVSSLEDTLISDGQLEIPEETINLIIELKRNGVQFAVATGRNYDAVYPMFGKAKNDIVYICNDGGVIIYQDKVISKTPVDRLICLDVAAELEKDPKFKLIFAGEREVMINTHDIDFINYIRRMGMEAEYVKDAKALNGAITKITICAKNGLDAETYEHFFKKWSGKANVAISNVDQAYVTGEYVTKGNGVALVQHMFNISEEDTVVFGGGYSDIDMFPRAYYSYAMQYADAQVRSSAKHIAENVNTILEDILRM